MSKGIYSVEFVTNYAFWCDEKLRDYFLKLQWNKPRCKWCEWTRTFGYLGIGLPTIYCLDFFGFQPNFKNNSFKTCRIFLTFESNIEYEWPKSLLPKKWHEKRDFSKISPLIYKILEVFLLIEMPLKIKGRKFYKKFFLRFPGTEIKLYHLI